MADSLPPRIALVGDRNDAVIAHRAIDRSFALLRENGSPVTATWLGTAELGRSGVAQLAEFAGVWCVPASPYADTDAALAAIRFAREAGLPFLGTCAGFQHALLEYVRNVVGEPRAAHEELSPGTEFPLLWRMSCSLIEVADEIELRPGSRMRAIIGADAIVEEFHCSYGLNPAYRGLLESSDLEVVGEGREGDVRAFELRGDRFYMGTAFQPERAALRGAVHPLVSAFAQAAAGAGGAVRT